MAASHTLGGRVPHGLAPPAALFKHVPFRPCIAQLVPHASAKQEPGSANTSGGQPGGSKARRPAERSSSPSQDAPPPPPPRAPKAQRQLFGALDALRGGNSNQAGASSKKGGFGKDKQPGRGKGPQGPGQSAPRQRAPRDSGPEDFVLLAPPPAASRTAAAAGAAVAVAAGVASSQGKGRDEPGPEDGDDGAQVWRERLEAVGWSYDEDEEEEDEEYEEFEETEEMDLEEGDTDQDMLVEVTPYGTWFAGEGEPAEETQEQQELRKWYTDKGGYLPPPRWGAIKVTNSAGPKRPVSAEPGSATKPVRGVVTEATLRAGDLVMVSQAVSMLEYEPGQGPGEVAEGPENEELADAMWNTCQVTVAQKQWLSEVLSSTRPDTPAPPGTRGPRLPTAADVAALHSNTGPTTPLKSEAPSKQWLYDLVNLNCMGEEFKELAASALREEDAPGWLALCPDAALVNHSCAPNSTAWVLGDRLVVRATDDIPTGQEVTLSYLGQLLTTPLQQRRAELRDKWGFHCTCNRCKEEEKAMPSGSPLEQVVQDTYTWCQDMSEVLNNALEAEDTKEVEEIRQDLLTKRDEFEGALRTAKVNSKARRYLQASVYDLYDMLSICADELSGAEPGAAAPKASKGGSAAGGPGKSKPQGPGDGLLDTENLAVCARILDAVNRGSDAQAYLAAEYMVRAGVRFGVKHQEAVESQKMCQLAFRSRFGPISPSLMDQLITARLDD